MRLARAFVETFRARVYVKVQTSKPRRVLKKTPATNGVKRTDERLGFFMYGLRRIVWCWLALEPTFFGLDRKLTPQRQWCMRLSKLI